MSRTCGSCGAEIEFALYGSAQGRRTPIDVGEFPGGPTKDDGALEVVGMHGFAPIVKSVPAHEREGRMLRRTHFGTCPDAEKWRKPR